MSSLDSILGWFSRNYDSYFGFKLFLMAIIITVIAIFIWEFYKSTSRRNIINLNLSKYNVSEYPVMKKIFALLLYLLEYMIIIPVLIMLWFAGLSIVLLLFSPSSSVDFILLVSGSLVASIRILAYYNREIAKDIGKLFPLITLSVFLLNPNSIVNFFDPLASKFNEIPELFTNIFSYVVIIFLVEFVLRILYTFYLFTLSEEKRALSFDYLAPSPEPVKGKKSKDG